MASEALHFPFSVREHNLQKYIYAHIQITAFEMEEVDRMMFDRQFIYIMKSNGKHILAKCMPSYKKLCKY